MARASTDPAAEAPVKSGYYISGALHAGFVGLLLFGGVFSNARAPQVTVADVTVLSEEEFAALVPPGAAPEIATQAPAPALPEVTEAPDVPEPETAPDRADPSVTEAPDAPETVPDAPELTPTPPADVRDTPPVLAPPAPIDRLGEVTPEDAAPAPAPRVAPEAAPPPPPTADIAPEAAPEVAAEPDAPPVEAEEESVATAPEEATTEIVTEAEERPNAAPSASMRPRARPSPPVVADTPAAPDIPVPDADAIAGALAEATGEASRPSGPPMTGGERDAFRLSVQRCWVVDVGSEAANVTVVVGFSMTPDGRVVDNDVRQVEASGGSDTAINTAFQAARRAILRCGASGFDLPVDKYDQWRDIEITFNPEGMRLR